ncbi:MAG: response regulator, partial [Nitrospira sp.]|nr:response regulator [Nitrospira sp.]
LLADDNADMRDYVMRLLSGQYHVEAVPDGASALRSALTHPPDLVLADIMMPGMDGLDLLRALRAEPTTRNIPIILLSARAGEESKVQGLETGADDYLVKPFASRELLARVKTHLELARARRRVTMELGSRLAELEQANTSIREGRLAALNILEDAVEARDRAEGLNRKLQQEITDRCKAESARKESEARLASDLAGMRRLHELHTRIATEHNVKTALAKILAAACDLTRTQRGCVQLVGDDGERLETLVWHGYADDSPVLQHGSFPWLQPVSDPSRQCLQRLIIQDVAGCAPLAGTEERDIMLAEGV